MSCLLSLTSLDGVKNGKKFGMKLNIVLKNVEIIKVGNNMITIFYDGKCGLCAKEINYYRRIAPVGILNWQDITESDDELKKREFLRRRV